MNTYKIKNWGNTIQIEITGNSIFNKKYIYTTIDHIANLLELENYYKCAIRTEYEEEKNK